MKGKKHKHKKKISKKWIFIAVVAIIILSVVINKQIENKQHREYENYLSGLNDTRSELEGFSSEVVKGDLNAPVTIIEFSDFECPYCQRFFLETAGQIDEKYVKTGKVKIIFKDFPLTFHTQAQKASEAAECAGDQGQFWNMHDKLFGSGVVGGSNTFKKYANDLNLNMEMFETCLDTGFHAAEVKADMQEGIKVGITGTPAFLINGRLITGAQPFSAFEKIIDESLVGFN